MKFSDSSSILNDMRVGPSHTDAEVDVYESDGDYRAFGFSRKAWGGEPIIDFITRDGNQQGFSYSHLYRVAFDPAKGITIEFTNHVAIVQGQFLTDLYRYLLAQRVVFIAEADETTTKLQLNRQLPFVSELAIQHRATHESNIQKLEEGGFA